MDFAAGEAIMAALLRQTNNSPAISLAVEIRLRNFRLAFLLLSPPHFAHSLAHLRSLSLRSKALLLARLLHRSLSLLLVAAPPGGLRLRDFDAAVLLLAMCDSYDPSSPAPTADWRTLIARRIACAALRPAGLGGGWWPAAAPHIEAAARCRRLVLSIAGGQPRGAATAAAAISLAAAEFGDCAICGEEVAGGAAMPCGHPFHWGCILEWLCVRNTCPCCRFELPTADVCGEVERVWKTALKLGGRFS